MRLIIPGLLLAFTIYCLIDVVRSEDSEVRGLPKLVWVLVVLLFPLAGGVAWFVAGRPRGTRPLGTDRVGRPKPRVLGPDDDPDFLRTIDRPRPVDPPTPLGPRPDEAPGAGPGDRTDGAAGTGDGDGPSPRGDDPKGSERPHDDPDGDGDRDATGRDDRRP